MATVTYETVPEELRSRLCPLLFPVWRRMDGPAAPTIGRTERMA